MKTRNLITGLILITSLTSCEKVLFNNPGEPVSVTVNPGRFSTIILYDIFDVELRSDSVFSYTLETFDDYLEKITISLDSGSLSLVDQNNLKWLTDYPRPKITISFPELTHRLEMQSPANIYSSDTLILPKMIIQCLGKTGDLNLQVKTDVFSLTTGSDNSGVYSVSGSAGHVRLWPRGSSIIDASELESETLNIYNNSIGDSRVCVRKKLEARLNSCGNVYYYGNPEEIILTEESGEGKLLKAD